MKKSYLIIAALVTISLLSSCKKDKAGTANSQKKLYLLSNEVSGTTSEKFVRYFTDGIATVIGDGTSFSVFGNDMEVSGDDVYVLGEKKVISSGVRSNVIYKNGIEIQNLPHGNNFFPNCLAISGADIYLAGIGVNANGDAKLKLWKNGVITEITDNSVLDTRVYDMVISGNDVYLAGYEENNTTGVRKATFWKNGIAIALTDGANGNEAEIHRILVNGTDVYCSGIVADKPAVWKNGTVTLLSNNFGYSYGIAVSGNDIYAAGAVDNGSVYHSAYWKNGTQVMISNNTNAPAGANAFGIGVDGTDVYVVGSLQQGNQDNPVYWKNGIATTLTVNSGNGATGYRMVLK